MTTLTSQIGESKMELAFSGTAGPEDVTFQKAALSLFVKASGRAAR